MTNYFGGGIWKSQLQCLTTLDSDSGPISKDFSLK